MIGVNGQWLLQFEVAGRSDFITAEEFGLFSITEEGNGKMPTYHLEFSSKVEELASLLVEGSSLKVLYGASRETLREAVLFIVKTNNSRVGDHQRSFQLAGFTVHPGWYANTKLTTCQPMSAVQRLKLLTSPYFRPDFNVESSSDSQIWLQPNTSDRHFAEQLWLHAYNPGGWYATAISIYDNTYRFLDMKKHLQTPYSWRFTPTATGPKDVAYEGDYSDRSSAGLMNTWIGYDRVQSWYNLETGQTEGFTPNVQTKLALSKGLNQRSEGMSPRLGKLDVLNANMDAHHHIAFYQNITSLALYSSYRLEFTFRKKYLPIRPLDLVLFKEDKLTTGGPKLSSEASSGLFLVSKITRTFEAQQAITTVEIAREAPGNMPT